MNTFDTICLVAGACMLTYWLVVKDDPKRQDMGGVIALVGAVLVGYILLSLFYDT